MQILNLIILFLLSQTHVPVVTLTARENQKLSKLLNKEFEKSVYWNEYKKNMILKIQQMNMDIFSNQTLLELTDCLF